MSHPLQSWPVAWGAAVVLHGVAALMPVRFYDDAEPQEFIDFELAEAPPPPPPPPPEPEPEPVKPPGPKNPDPKADPNRTSVESNREVEEPPDKPVPLRTGLALDPDQLAADDMGVRVGNTNESGYDADVEPGEVQGFEGGGAGGGEGQVVAAPPDVKAQLLRAFQPRYPEHLVALDIDGRVVLLIEILTNGRAGKVEVLESAHPDLDRAAVEALKRFRWSPARRDGQKVTSTMRLTVRFVVR